MTREELDFIGAMNMCDEISNEAYKKIVCHFEEQEPCDDCVSRQAVDDAIYDYSRSCDVNYSQLMEFIDKIPPVKPAEKQEPCKDCISRAYIEPIVEELENICINGDKSVLDMLSNIKNAPPVKPTEKVGQWISNAEDDLKISEYTCSNCKGLSDEDSDYCPKCGSYNGGAK